MGIFKKISQVSVLLIAIFTSLLYLTGLVYHQSLMKAFGVSYKLFRLSFYDTLTYGIEIILSTIIVLFVSIIALIIIAGFFLVIIKGVVGRFIKKSWKTKLKNWFNKSPKNNDALDDDSDWFEKASHKLHSIMEVCLWVLFPFIILLLVIIYRADWKGTEIASYIKQSYRKALHEQTNFPHNTYQITLHTQQQSVMGVVVEQSDIFTMVYDTSGVQLINNADIEKMELLVKKPAETKIDLAQ